MKVDQSVVAVTGGASGLGRGVAEHVVERGGHAIILDLASSAGADVAAQLGAHARFVACDVTQPDSVEAAVAGAAEAFGRIDTLVSCAGISIGARMVNRDGTLHSLELYRRHVEVNLIGLFDVVRHAAGVMARNEPGPHGERGLVVNIASIAGYEGQVGQVAYGSTKGGVIAMTMPLARDLATIGVRVMCICPGTMDTPMLATLSADYIERLAAANLFPKRLGTPRDLAELVAHLMENSFLNGEVVRLDAGLRLSPK